MKTYTFFYFVLNQITYGIYCTYLFSNTLKMERFLISVPSGHRPVDLQFPLCRSEGITIRRFALSKRNGNSVKGATPRSGELCLSHEKAKMRIAAGESIPVEWLAVFC